MNQKNENAKIIVGLVTVVKRFLQKHCVRRSAASVRRSAATWRTNGGHLTDERPAF